MSGFDPEEVAAPGIAIEIVNKKTAIYRMTLCDTRKRRSSLLMIYLLKDIDFLQFPLIYINFIPERKKTYNPGKILC